MHSFEAIDGTKWSFAISYGTVQQVLEDTGFKLTDLFYDNKAAAPILGDAFQFLRVMFSALKPQAKQLGKSFEDFLAGMDDTVLAKATDALLEAVVDFFHEPRRTLVRRALEKYRSESERLTSAATLVAEKKLEEMDVAAIIVQTLTSSDSSSPASAA